MKNKKRILYNLAGYFGAIAGGFFSGNYFNSYYSKIKFIRTIEGFKESVEDCRAELIREDCNSNPKFSVSSSSVSKKIGDYSGNKNITGDTGTKNGELELKLKGIDVRNNQAILNGNDGNLYIIRIDEKKQKIFVRNMAESPVINR